MSTATAKQSAKKENVIPASLIYEMDEGTPIYYRGYKEVLNKKKTLEQITGSSALQSLLIVLIIKHLSNHLSNDYAILSSELGFKFVFLSNKYIEIAPEVVIEIDAKAEFTESLDFDSYFQKKTDQLLEADVQRVIWIFTATKKHLVAVKDQKWEIDNWTTDVAVTKDISLNIPQLLESF